MADRLEILTKTPKWQLAVGWVAVAALIGVGWYFFYYADAVASREQAETAKVQAQDRLAKMQKELEAFEQRMAKEDSLEREIEERKRQLPLSAATIDHLMRQFQQQGRLVGVDVANWRPGSEERRDFYAKMPVEVSAQGTWHQMGEFFRRVSEMEKIVNIEEVSMQRGRATEDNPRMLDVTFKASTFRFLEQQPAAGAGADGQTSNRRRRQEGEG